jgi:hypothetical protein
MGAAERIQEVDAFEATRGHLAAMEKRLSSRDMMNVQHGELEQYVIEEGRELQRLLLQAHLELRAERERRVEVKAADRVPRTMTRGERPPTDDAGGSGQRCANGVPSA